MDPEENIDVDDMVDFEKVQQIIVNKLK